MLYFLKHICTDAVFFEEKKNFMEAFKSSLALAESECRDGFDFSITVGCAKSIQQEQEEALNEILP